MEEGVQNNKAAGGRHSQRLIALSFIKSNICGNVNL
jgi:hypothetical protein